MKTRKLPNGRRELLDYISIQLPFSCPVNRICRNGNVGWLDGKPSKSRIMVQQGFETDFSSIPPAVHWIVRWSRVDVAGVVHDWLYRDTNLPRRWSDRVWRNVAMQGEHRASWMQATVCYLVLRAFGGWARLKCPPIGDVPRKPEHCWSAFVLVLVLVLVLLPAVLLPILLHFILSRGSR